MLRIRGAATVPLSTLGYREERVEVSFFLHQFIKGSMLCYDAVFQGKQSGAAAQDVFIKVMGDDHAGVSVEVHDRVQHLKDVSASRLAVASSMNRTGVFRNSALAMEIRCRSPPERPEPFSPQR